MAKVLSIIGLSALVLGSVFWSQYQTPLKFISEFISAADFSSDQTPLVFTGDVMLARNVETISKTEGAKYLYEKINTFFTGKNVIVNFEAAIPKTHVPTPNFTFAFSVDPTLIPALKHAGVTHASLANNHSNDFGRDGAQNTSRELTQAGITAFGGGAAPRSVVITAQAGSVAVTGMHTVQGPEDMATIAEEFYELSLRSDLQIAYVHWGTEYDPRHDESQAQLARELIDIGYDAVIGHHPHVVQDVDWYKESPIFYSLGNFIFDQYFSKEVQEGLLVELIISDQKVSYQLVGVTSSDHRSQQRLMTVEEQRVFLQDLAARSNPVVQEQVAAGSITQQIK